LKKKDDHIHHYSFFVRGVEASPLLYASYNSTVEISGNVFKVYNCPAKNDWSKAYGENEFIPRRITETIKITVQLTCYHGKDHLVVEEPKKSIEMYDTFKKMFENKILTDLELHCSEKVFKCHRAVLSCHSDVFAAMFKHNLSEKLEGIVKIEDCITPHVVEAFLYYCYTGKIQDGFNDFQGLFYIAEKYAVDPLKSQCMKKLPLSKTISLENSVDVLIMLNRYNFHNDVKIKNEIFHFILNNLEAVKKQKNFSKLKDVPDLLVSLLSTSAKNRGRKRKIDEIEEEDEK